MQPDEIKMPARPSPQTSNTRGLRDKYAKKTLRQKYASDDANVPEYAVRRVNEYVPLQCTCFRLLYCLCAACWPCGVEPWQSFCSSIPGAQAIRCEAFWRLWLQSPLRTLHCPYHCWCLHLVELYRAFVCLCSWMGDMGDTRDEVMLRLTAQQNDY